MSLSMYSSSVPVLSHYLKALSAILGKAQQYAAEKNIDDKVLTGFRLYPDMFPLARQVQIACDTAKGCGARLAGVEAPKFEDNEGSFAELQQRVARTLDFLATLEPEQIDGSEERRIVFKAGPRELEFIGRDYLLSWVYPNFHFHLTTAYNILRHNGLAIGKRDYLGG